MIVPDFWAEAHTSHGRGRKQIKVRRFGWSDVSQQEAYAMAELRAGEALARLVAGERLHRRERKAAYNGAQGLPIREEVLARHGEEVITRNAYGARCLNTPRALFADIDFEPPRVGRDAIKLLAVLLLLSAVVGGLLLRNLTVALGLAALSAVLAWPLAALLRRVLTARQGDAGQQAQRRVRAFLAGHPTWALRLYKTPAGLRLLATHQPFEAASPEVQQFFAAVGADPVYVRMCNNQRCFRARLSAKPWRIGITGHIRPRPGVWPVDPARMAPREAWLAQYDTRAADYAACHFVESLGSGTVHPDLRALIDLHDRESRAMNAGLAMA